LDFPKDKITISLKDNSSPFYYQSNYVILGSTGYLGNFTELMLKEQNKTFSICNERLHKVDAIENFLVKSRCKYVICAAGVSGRPTTQWCEDNEQETFETNFIDVVNLMRLTQKLKLHFTYFGTALLYSPTPEKHLFVEEDTPDLTTSVYCRIRIELEKYLRLYDHVLMLRIIYPITADDNPKCFLTKMRGRTENVHNVDIAVTIVPSLFPLIPILVEKGTTGPIHFVNSSNVRLPELLDIFNIKYASSSGEPKLGAQFSTKKLAACTGSKIETAQYALGRLAENYKKRSA
jgi:dTDP-4-dehydrorhamnose reductase